MKNIKTISILLLALALSNPLFGIKASEKQKKEAIVEKWLPTALTTLWAGTVGLDSLCYVSRNIRETLYSYGHNRSTKGDDDYIIDRIMHSCNTFPEHINFSFNPRKIWSALAGNVFSNHDTLFMDKELFERIGNNVGIYKYAATTNIKALDEKTKKELITALIMIDTHYDAKLLALSIAIPPLVWATTYGVDYVIQKLNSDQQHKWLKKIAALTSQCKKSFIAKAAISTSIIATFILYQRLAISAQTTTIMSNL